MLGLGAQSGTIVPFWYEDPFYTIGFLALAGGIIMEG